MTTATIARAAASTIVALKGRGKASREQAYLKIAPLSFVENVSRVETIANMRVALGVSPGVDELKAAQVEYVIGRVAARLPASEFPRAVADSADKLEFARDIVTKYAAPAVEGKKARKLRAGQLGRRSPVQHKVTRAAEEAWSQVNAELGHGTAKTQAEKNKAKRSTNTNPVRGDDKSKVAAPTHSELIKAPKPTDATEACRFVETQAATLLAFCNKHAKFLPTDYGMAVNAFKTAINKAANERAVREAATK